MPVQPSIPGVTLVQKEENASPVKRKEVVHTELPAAMGKTPSGISALGNRDFGRSQASGGAMTASYLPSSEGQGTVELDDAGKAFAGLILKASSSELEARWAGYVGERATQGGSVDVNSLVESVLREAYASNSGDLRFYAEKVQFYNDLKKDIRDELTKARESLAKMAGAPDTAKIGDNAQLKGQFPGGYPQMGVDGTYYGGTTSSAVALDGSKATTKGELDAYIKKLEEKLNSVGDDAQLANVDLQNMLQKQQQTLQMVSNISKMLHDTGMAVIRKIGA